MLAVNERYYVCEDGHVTAGRERGRLKCTAEPWNQEYVKGKKKAVPSEVKLKKMCGKKIVKEDVLPTEIDYKQVWDPEVMHAFLIGQKLDAEFMLGLQRFCSELYAQVERLSERSAPLIRISAVGGQHG